MLLLEQPRTHGFHPVTWSTEAQLTPRGCGAHPSSVAAWPKTWPRADRASDRKPFQVPGPSQGRKESGTWFFDVLRRMHRGSCSGNLGRSMSDVGEAVKASPVSPAPPVCGMQCTSCYEQQLLWSGYLGVKESKVSQDRWCMQSAARGQQGEGRPLAAANENARQWGRRLQQPSRVRPKHFAPALGTLHN